MDDDKRVQAIFTAQRTLTIQNMTKGSVTSDPAGISCPAGAKDCSAQFPSGTQIKLTGEAGNTYFSGACAGYTCEFQLTQPQTVTAEYVAP